MPLICVCSPKGGVGKTTLAANLAYSLARTGSKVLALDFDVQNALRLHFGVPLNDERGYVAKALELHDWSQCVLSAGSNIFVLPYGEVSEAQRQAFDEQLTHNDHFLQRGLSALLNYPGLITIADMPPGPSPALKALTGLADLHLIPLLADTASMSTLAHVEKQRLTGAAIGIGSIAALIVGGLYLLNPFFSLLARFGGREVMTAAALLVVLGSALLMQAGGLSMAMGAFLAGVLLSESTFRHQLEADVEPFRGLLLGLFFLGVGMALNLTTIAENWLLIVICVPAYMILKMLVIYCVARIWKANKAEALERAVLMAQGGEFAFVLYAAAAGAGVITQQDRAVLTAIVIVSMVLTPLLIILHDRLVPKAQPSLDGIEAARDLHAQALIIGFGRMGQVISQPLLARGYSLSVIEKDPQMIRDADEFGFKVWYGDGTRLDVLRAAGAENASIIIAVPDDKEAVNRITELAKAEFPMVPVLARAFDREHALELVQHGVDYQMRETLQSAIAMGREALIRLGDDDEVADEVMADIRNRDAERFELECVGGLSAGVALILSNRNTSPD